MMTEMCNQGDTLYVSGSPVHYGSLTVSKRLNIIGPGYFLEENPNTQVGFLPAKVTSPTFKPGAEESVISGMMIDQGMYVQCDGVVIKNNYVHTQGNVNWGSNKDFIIKANNVIVSQNFITSSSDYCWPLYLDGYNIVVSNNYIYRLGTATSGSSIIANNVFKSNRHPAKLKSYSRLLQ
ncbi:MAG: hypothetical protein AB7S75_17460 [Desulfococcaceae bacterium]